MARGRMIASTVGRDKRLNDLPVESELVYLLAVPHLDRDGLIEGDALVLWGRVCPRRPELMPTMETIIAAWVQSGLVMRYETGNGDVLYFYGFHKNQIGMRYDREPESLLDIPPGFVRTPEGLAVAEESRPPAAQENTDGGEHPESIRQPSGNLPPECEVEVEVEVEVETEVEEKSAADAAPVAPPQPKRRPSPRKKPEPQPETPKDADHPAVKVYRDLHKINPSKAQMQIIAQHDPPLDTWIRAVSTWAARGYNPKNVEGMLEWALNPAKMERNSGAPPGAVNGYAPNNKVANNQNEVRKAFDRLRAQEASQ